MQDRDVGLRRVRIGEWPHVTDQRLVDRERVDVRHMVTRSEQAPDPPSAVADCVPFVRRRDPLVYDHVNREIEDRRQEAGDPWSIGQLREAPKATGFILTPSVGRRRTPTVS